MVPSRTHVEGTSLLLKPAFVWLLVRLHVPLSRIPPKIDLENRRGSDVTVGSSPTASSR
jgi:hypothetical protein